MRRQRGSGPQRYRKLLMTYLFGASELKGSTSIRWTNIIFYSIVLTSGWRAHPRPLNIAGNDSEYDVCFQQIFDASTDADARPVI